MKVAANKAIKVIIDEITVNYNVEASLIKYYDMRKGNRCEDANAEGNSID